MGYLHYIFFIWDIELKALEQVKCPHPFHKKYLLTIPSPFLVFMGDACAAVLSCAMGRSSDRLGHVCCLETFLARNARSVIRIIVLNVSVSLKRSIFLKTIVSSIVFCCYQGFSGLHYGTFFDVIFPSLLLPSSPCYSFHCPLQNYLRHARGS